MKPEPRTPGTNQTGNNHAGNEMDVPPHPSPLPPSPPNKPPRAAKQTNVDVFIIVVEAFVLVLVALLPFLDERFQQPIIIFPAIAVLIVVFLQRPLRAIQETRTLVAKAIEQVKTETVETQNVGTQKNESNMKTLEAKLKAEDEKLRVKVDELETISQRPVSLLPDLKKEIDEIKSQLIRIGDMDITGKVADIQKHLGTFKADSNILIGYLTAGKNGENFGDLLVSISESIPQLQTEVTRLTKDIGKVSGQLPKEVDCEQISALNGKMPDLYQKLKDFQNGLGLLGTLSVEIGSVKSAFTEGVSDVKKAQVQISNSSQTIERASGTFGGLDTKLAEVHRDVGSAQRTIDRAATAVIDARESIDISNTKIGEGKGAVEAATREISKFEGTAEKSTSALETSRKQIEGLQKVQGDLNTGLRETSKKVGEDLRNASEENKKLFQEKAALDREVGELKREREKAKQDAEEAEKRLRADLDAQREKAVEEASKWERILFSGLLTEDGQRQQPLFRTVPTERAQFLVQEAAKGDSTAASIIANLLIVQTKGGEQNGHTSSGFQDGMESLSRLLPGFCGRHPEFDATAIAGDIAKLSGGLVTFYIPRIGGLIDGRYKGSAGIGDTIRNISAWAVVDSSTGKDISSPRVNMN